MARKLNVKMASEISLIDILPDEPILIKKKDLESFLMTISRTINVKKILTAKETAEYLGISIAKLRDLTKKRKIKYYKLQGKVLFKTVDLDEMLERNMIESIGDIKQRAFNRGK